AMTDPAHALTPSQVFGSQEVGDQRGLVFIDTLDQQPPNETNQVTLTLEAPYMEGTFYINAHVVLQPLGTGRMVPAFAPPPEGQPATTLYGPASTVGVTINGVLYTAWALRVGREVRAYGSVAAERGLTGAGLLEAWYDADLRRRRVGGLAVGELLRGTWLDRWKLLDLT